MIDAVERPWWKRPPWRTIVPVVLSALAGVLAWIVWSPGKDVRDGRHDRGRNGLWLAHGWIGADEWFTSNFKTHQVPQYRDEAQVRRLIERSKHHGITDLFPHLCPTDFDGVIPPVDPVSTERFLDLADGLRVIPWVGGPSESRARHRDPEWRARFAASIGTLLANHPRLAGVQLNLEPMRSGDADFLTLLETVRSQMPPDKLLSVAAYPPPTRWHPYPDVHWEQSYFREVARRCDQLAVMMYDTALRSPKLYERLMADWTSEILEWSEGKSVLLGVPTYEDADSGYHHPGAEDLACALRGIHAGLMRAPLPAHYQGLAVYCDWETGEQEWLLFRERFARKLGAD